MGGISRRYGIVWERYSEGEEDFRGKEAITHRTRCTKHDKHPRIECIAADPLN